MMTSGTYDEALERYHRTGPEFDGWLSNHGPMVVEAMARHGCEDHVHAWTDQYSRRLDEAPRGIDPIDPAAWRDPLGDPLRTGDWIDLMTREVRAEPWRDVLARWWPRLLPGITGGATHGVIRVGHAVQALAAQETAPRLDELGHALAYWASRWQHIAAPPALGGRDVRAALAAVAAVPLQEYGIRNRLAQLPELPPQDTQPTHHDGAAAARARLDDIVDAAVERYVHWAHGNPTMLVHAATAPAAVARALPHLPAELADVSVAAAWTATSAVTAAYRPSVERPAPAVDRSADELWEAAVAHGGEHVVKLADTALASAQRTGNDAGLRATALAITLDA